MKYAICKDECGNKQAFEFSDNSTKNDFKVEYPEHHFIEWQAENSLSDEITELLEESEYSDHYDPTESALDAWYYEGEANGY